MRRKEREEKMKKIISLCLCLAFLCLCSAALASTGDLTLARYPDGSGSVDQVYLAGRKVFILGYANGNFLEIYDLDARESHRYSLQELNEKLALENAENAGAEGAGISEQIACWFEHKGDLYAVVTSTRNEEERVSMGDTTVRKLSLEGEEATLVPSDFPALDWSAMAEEDGDYIHSRYIAESTCAGDCLYLSYYDDSGNQAVMVYDLTTGDAEERYIPDLYAIGPCDEERILLVQFRWGERPTMMISRYDGLTDDAEELVRFDASDGTPGSVAYDTQNDILYYVKSGEIYAAPGGNVANAEPVNDCPTTGRTVASLTEDGFLLVHDYSTALLRNTDPSQRAKTTLHVRPYAWTSTLNSAYYDFTASHGDVTVVMEEYGTDNALLQAMMNRDARVDVYVMDMAESAYNAIYDRGFMTDLSGSAYLNDAAAKMYPAMRDSIMKDGKLVAIPVSTRGDWLGYNVKVWKELGLTDADVPHTWNQFFDFLETLPEKVQGTSFRAFEVYANREDFRYSVLSSILAQYAMTRPDMPYNSQMLLGVLERLNAVDFDALGIMTQEEMDQENEYGNLNTEQEPLIHVYSSLTLEQSYSLWPPFLLSFEEGEKAELPMRLTVAWVNPYSQNQEEAIAFMESILSTTDVGTRYSLSSENNEPVRYPDHEETKQTLAKWVEEARKNVEKAEDEEEKEQWESILADYEKNLAEYDDNSWKISPDSIRMYQGWAENLQPLRWSLMSQMINGSDSETFWMMYQGFLDGDKAPDEFLSYIDRKVQMMRLEGN